MSKETYVKMTAVTLLLWCVVMYLGSRFAFDGFPVRFDLAIVTTPGQLVECAAPGRTDGKLERGQRHRRQIADGSDPKPAQPRRGGRADAPQRLDRLRMEEGELGTGRHHNDTLTGHDPGRRRPRAPGQPGRLWSRNKHCGLPWK